MLYRGIPCLITLLQEHSSLGDLLASPVVFTLIMYTHPVRPEDLALLQSYGEKHKTPLVAIHSAGFYSYFCIHLPGAFPIVDTHPDETATTDLRLLTPWPESVSYTHLTLPTKA